MTHRIKILYAEDQADESQSIYRSFSRAGFDVVVVKTVDEAVDCLKREEYSALLLDIMLPANRSDYRPKDIPQYFGGVKILELLREGLSSKVVILRHFQFLSLLVSHCNQ